MNRLYVGNIRYTADESSLRALFEAFGPVAEVFLGMDRETGQSRGFAFVTMRDATGAQAAIAGLHGKEVDGRSLVVSEAQPRGAPGERRTGPPPSGSRFGGGGGASGAGGDGGGRHAPPHGQRDAAGSGERRDGSGRGTARGPVFRQPPYLGPPPEGRAPKGGKPGRDRKGDWERGPGKGLDGGFDRGFDGGGARGSERRERGRERERFDRDADEW